MRGRNLGSNDNDGMGPFDLPNFPRQMSVNHADDDDFDWGSQDDDDFGLPPASQNAPRVAPPEGYFFAHNEDEYNERVNAVRELNDDFSAYQAKAQQTTLKTKNLKKNPSTDKIRAQLIANIDEQILKLNLYKGLLEDLLRRHNGIHQNRGNDRSADFQYLPTLSPGKDREDEKRIITEKLQHIAECARELDSATNRVSKDSAIQPRKNIFYSNLNEYKVFTDPDNAINILSAKQKAYEFLGTRRQQQQRGQPQALNAAVGIIDNNSEPDHTCRFIATEVMTKPGKPTIPVGLVQVTNPEKTYSTQTAYLLPGDLNQLDKMPLFTKDKIAKIKEQMKFISHFIETSLASITLNGPVVMGNCPSNLARAAAVYCHVMGYDLYPKSYTSNVKDAEMETLKQAFNKQLAEDPLFKAQIDEAKARHETNTVVKSPNAIR